MIIEKYNFINSLSYFNFFYKRVIYIYIYLFKLDLF